MSQIESFENRLLGLVLFYAVSVGIVLAGVCGLIFTDSLMNGGFRFRYYFDFGLHLFNIISAVAAVLFVIMMMFEYLPALMNAIKEIGISRILTAAFSIVMLIGFVMFAQRPVLIGLSYVLGHDFQMYVYNIETVNSYICVIGMILLITGSILLSVTLVIGFISHRLSQAHYRRQLDAQIAADKS